MQQDKQDSKKVLIFSTAYYPYVGGAEVAIKEITDRIPDVEFHLITARFSKKIPFKEKIGNVLVYRLGVGIPLLDKLLLPFEGALFVRHLQKKNNYQAFWCVMATFASGAAYLSNIFSNKKVPIILNLQEGDSEEHFSKRWFGLIDLSWKMALKRTHILTVLSQFLKDRAERFGYKGEARIIPNGVDLNKFKIENSKLKIKERQEIRNELGLQEKDIVLITSSRLVVKNGVGDVIEALTLLPKEVKFIICGVGELETSLKLKVKRLKLEDRVIFKGFVSHTEMPKYLKACDIFIRASLSEGMGNSFIEAFASGIPVVATPVGGIVDFLKDPTSQGYDGTSVQTGYFCEPENPESIAATVKRVIADPNKDKVVENAYNLAIEKYDWDKIAPEMRKVFDL